MPVDEAGRLLHAVEVHGLHLVLEDELEALAERQRAVEVELVGVRQLVAQVGVAVADRLEPCIVKWG